MADTLNGAFNLDDPLSKEHWMSSFDVLTLVLGGRGAAPKSGGPTLPKVNAKTPVPKIEERANLDVNKRKNGTEGTPKAGVDFIEETRYGGKLYSERDIQLLNNYLEKRGVKLKVGDEFLPPGKGGGFNYITDELVLRSNPTQYEVWHELSHYIQYKKIGKDAYTNLPRTQGKVPKNDLSQFNAPEQFVFDMLSNSEKRWNLLNERERQHAIDYIMEYGGIR
ncbi:Rhs core protein with extension [Paenibacillus alvei TS-15]|uniref:Rhs core protein with extension n=1 Tax=Paenibacillus alvei TS-15 TaxID=1117108 RepID=S9SLT5_PAEAL|nr:zincin-like metallopeptidase toxin domain-containing protein [Paenibacillus alvei]EPY05634.1 Rhs core protein with extension [Paenibacillus alvei TS-15]